MSQNATSRMFRAVVATLLLSAMVSTAAWSCGNGAATSSSTSATVATTDDADSTTDTTTPPPTVMSPEARRLIEELKKSGKLAVDLGVYLQDKGASVDDPRMAVVWGLRAASQAATVQKALLDHQPELADAALLEMRKHLTRAGAIAQGDTAAAVKAAQEHLAAVATPSADPKAAAAALDTVLADLEPLLTKADGILGQTATTTGS